MVDTGLPRYCRSLAMRRTDGRDLTAGCSRLFTGWRYVGLPWRCLAHGHFLQRRRCRDRSGPQCQHRQRSRVQPGGGPWLPLPGVRRRHDPAQNEGSMACSSAIQDLPPPAMTTGWLACPAQRRRRQSHRGCMASHFLVSHAASLAQRAGAGWKTDIPDVKDMTPRCARGEPIAGFQAAADPTLRAGIHGSSI